MRNFEESFVKQAGNALPQLEFLIEMGSGEARETINLFSIVSSPSLGSYAGKVWFEAYPCLVHLDWTV